MPEEVTYTHDHWKLLRELRAISEEMIAPLHESHINSFVYGSIARGDVNENSDVDIFIPNPPSPTMLEATLELAGKRFISREIIQATPSYAPKAYLYTDERRGYSFPLVKLWQNEAEFYDFAGHINYKELQNFVRKPGVDKRLVLIMPTPEGHFESSVPGREGEVASILGVSVRIVRERVRTLKRRERVGRTGVYLKRELSRDEDISNVYNELVKGHAPMRRRTRKK